jgi:hypothetical protein
MTSDFVAVLRAESVAYRPALLAAGARAVLSWSELATSTERDDAPAVLLDVPDLLPRPDAPELGDRLAAVLGALTSVDSPIGSSGGPADASRPAERNVVIATVRPVIDTLKLVDAAGVLTGTAERDEHRFVGAPIAARLRVLRAVSREQTGTEREQIGTEEGQIGPSPVAVLAALVGSGATVLGHQP